MTARNLRPATKPRCRAWWDDFLRTWERIGRIAAAELQLEGEALWRFRWTVDRHGRHISYPWRDKRR